jgi:GNAT superfamily N-acetyltransferase
MPAARIALRTLAGDQAASHLDEYRALYAEVYAEPPYEWGEDHSDLFADRFQVQRRQSGFALVEARDGTELVGLTFGVTLQPTTPWWNNLTTPLPAAITTERPGRTFALVELLVRAPWRRQGIAQAMHDLLLKDRTEERATLTVLPAASPAQAAYQKWGWHKVVQKRNPLPGSPLFDVMFRQSGAVGDVRADGGADAEPQH